VDYYFAKKLAWHYCRRSQKPYLAMVSEIVGWNHDVVLANDTLEKVRFKWQVEDGDSGEVLLSGSTDVPAGENANVGSFKVDPSAQRLLLIRYEVNGVEMVNHFITGFPKYRKADLLRWLEIIRKQPDGFEITL
jgi:beta-mannosidase